MTIYKRVKGYNFLAACSRIRHGSRRHIRSVGDAFKATAALQLAFFISILTASSLQACQPVAGREVSKTAENQDDIGPQLPPDAELIRDSINGTIRILKGTNLSTALTADEEYQSAFSSGLPGKTAIAFINTYRRLFKLHDPKSELRVGSITTDKLGMTHVRLKQQYQGLEVWPADINVHLDKSGAIYLVQGRYVKTPSNSVADGPRLEESDALRSVSIDLASGEGFRRHRTELMIYCGLPRAPRLAYRIYAEVGVDDAWNYIVDARTGSILEKTSAIQNQGVVRKPPVGKIILK